ncbi:MAG: hypothetical protein J6V07_02400, partial [Clostridia bacterium]|nr:hypothetical protein [Clostridia bacterium]
GRVLDSNEVARNHLADLAKWFKLDLTYLHDLDEASLIAVATDPTITALSVSDDKEDVQEAVDASAWNIIKKKYSGTLSEDMIAVLGEYFLDGAPLLKYPKGLLPNTYSFLGGGYAKSEDVKADYAKALAADLAALSSLIGDWGAEEYNALYVQRGLVYALDFFKTNEYWDDTVEVLTKDASNSYKQTFKDRYVWRSEVNPGDGKEVEINFTWGTTESVEIKDGHFDTQNLGEVVLWSLAGLTNQSKAPDGATADMLVQVSPGAGSMPLIFNNIRPYLTTYNDTEMKLTSIGVNNTTNCVTNIKYNDKDVTLKIRSAPASLAMTTLVNTGSNGDFALYEDGGLIYDNKGGMSCPTGLTYTQTNWRYNTVKDNSTTDALKLDVYAARYYNRVLTADEIAQNHFADLAKFFRLDLTGFDMLPDSQKQAVYDAAIGLEFTSSREDIQALVLSSISKGYKALKGEDAKVNAMIDLAAEYLLDLGELFAATRDMSSVYDSVETLAVAMTGKSKAGAQAALDEAIFDAWHYLSYKVDDEADQAEKFNAMLVWCATNCSKDAYVDLEALMALPYAKRLGALDAPKTSVEEAQEFIDAYVADRMAEYEVDGGDFDYDALYVQDGLRFAVDFFKTNRYWNPEGAGHIAYAAPTGAAENTAYWYDANENGAVDDGETYNFTLSSDNHNTDAFKAAHAEWKTADSAFLKQFVIYPAEGSVMGLSSYDPIAGNSTYFGDAARTAKVFSAYTVGDGYIQMRTDHHSSGGLSVYGAGSPLASDANTMQLTAAMGGNLHNAYPPVIFHGIYAKGTTSAGTYTYNGFYSNNSVFGSFASGAKGFTNSATVPVSLTYSVLDGDAAGADTFRVADQNEVLATAIGTCPSSTSIQIGWMNSAKAMRIYAIRYYTTDLTVEQRQQNHFADLAKFFKLDVSAWSFMPDSIRKQAYAAVARFTFDSDPTKIQEAIDTSFATYYVAFTLFDGEGADEKNADFRELATATWMNLEAVRNLNAEKREAIMGGLVDSFDLDYAFSREVFAGEYNILVKPLTAMTFAG